MTRAMLLVAGLVILLFATTNLPWTLDDYDQAKQAYTSFEMVRQGHWLYEHTPNEGVATKPPLVGWVSAGIFALTRSWETAWRLPSLLAALALLWVLARAGAAAYGPAAGLLTMSAFGLNLLSARLATLVRTDMPLALTIFLIGLQIWRKIRSGEPWNTRDRVLACLLLTSTMLIKGPIVFAFILPGLVAYQLLRRRRVAPSAWCGWWPWVLALAIFLLWAVGGILRQPGFYETVVLKEFAGRFTETVHKPQPSYFYFPHLLQKFAPWSLLLIGLGFVLRRRRAAMEPATLWLVCWSVGGLLLMSAIPSKRVDRIFPVLPPLCLLLGAQIAAASQGEGLREKMRPWLSAALLFAAVFTGGYTAWKIGNSLHKKKAALVDFAAAVRARTGDYEVVGGHEEGLLLYLRRDHFLSPQEAARRWESGQLNAVIAPNDTGRPWPELLLGARPALTSEKSLMVPPYSLWTRPAP